jgi:hypothetical protein|tara:strand:- start:972 stop:1547 length:576 start_codon:yes stop_codon:yes gene_type:complete
VKNLKDYILHLDNWIPKKILNDTIKELSKNKTWQRHTYSDSKTFKLKSKNKNKELDICYGNNLSYLKELHQLTWKALEKYIVIEKIGGESFNGWNGFNQIRFNRYSKNQIMSKHCDHIQSLFTGEKRGIPILSIVGVLNNDYQGGEFIMFDDYEIKFKAGDLIIFPSVFLYPHLVKPIKKGIRYSFVSWCY